MGDHLANEETLVKLHLGRAWQAQAGSGYRYFLVFRDKDISMTGAYPKVLEISFFPCILIPNKVDNIWL